jgi:hypothetical protein
MRTACLQGSPVAEPRKKVEEEQTPKSSNVAALVAMTHFSSAALRARRKSGVSALRSQSSRRQLNADTANDSSAAVNLGSKDDAASADMKDVPAKAVPSPGIVNGRLVLKNPRSPKAAAPVAPKQPVVNAAPVKRSSIISSSIVLPNVGATQILGLPGATSQSSPSPEPEPNAESVSSTSSVPSTQPTRFSLSSSLFSFGSLFSSQAKVDPALGAVGATVTSTATAVAASTSVIPAKKTFLDFSDTAHTTAVVDSVPARLTTEPARPASSRIRIALDDIAVEDTVSTA